MPRAFTGITDTLRCSVVFQLSWRGAIFLFADSGCQQKRRGGMSTPRQRGIRTASCDALCSVPSTQEAGRSQQKRGGDINPLMNLVNRGYTSVVE